MRIFLALMCLFFLNAYNYSDSNPKTLFIKGATIIDLSNNGNSFNDIEESYLILSENEIIEFGKLEDLKEIPSDSRIIDASGKFIIPGLIDGFAVINNQAYAYAFLYSGVTTVIGVDGGRRGKFDHDVSPSPDYYMLESIGDEHESDLKHLNDLDSLHKKEFNIALLKYKLKPNQVAQVHAKAHQYGMGTIGELGYTSYKEGAAVGIDAFVHTTRYSLDAAPKDLRLGVAEDPFSDDPNSPKWQYYKYLYSIDTSNQAFQLHAKNLANSKTFLMPTFSLLYGDLPGHNNPWEEEIAVILNAQDINNPLDKETGNHNYSEQMQSNYTSMALQELLIERAYFNAGCRYLAGSATDVWGTMPGISLHTELYLLSKIGLTNRQVLAAASTNFAEAFRWKTGKIEKGFEADIIILSKNPLENLEVLKETKTVINNGNIIDINSFLNN